MSHKQMDERTFGRLTHVRHKLLRIDIIVMSPFASNVTDTLRSELPRPIPWNSVESDLGCTSRIYFDNVTLT